MRLVAALALTFALFAAGPIGCSGIAPGADPIAVTAERTIQTAFESVNTFLVIEDQNRATVKQQLPEVHAFAEMVRKGGKEMFRDAWQAERAYRAVNTPGNAETLQDKLKIVENLARQAREYLAKLR